MLGTVKSFHRDWGFLICENGDEVFVHGCHIVKSYPDEQPSLWQRQKVEFGVVLDHKTGRWYACGVKRLD